MEKAKVFIASSGRTLTLAEMLRDQLETEFCEATLWTEESRHQPGATIIDMLENAAEKYDFAAILLSRDDVVVGEAGDRLKARDNCVFEAGLFVAYLKRERCFLVNSVDQRDLPSDLGGVISLPFTEPHDLDDRGACAGAVRRASSVMKDSIQRLGRAVVHTRLPLLSIDEVIQRERPLSEKGDLRESEVVICDSQPTSAPEMAVQVRRNMDAGIQYFYFLSPSDDCIEKICQALQIILVSGVAGTARMQDFSGRLKIVQENNKRILEDLSNICSAHSLHVSFLLTAPTFCFRVHNASDEVWARLYARYRSSGFMLWADGESAVSLWRSLPAFLPTEDRPQIVIPLKNFSFGEEQKRRMDFACDRGLNKYFPGIRDEVKELFLGPW